MIETIQLHIVEAKNLEREKTFTYIVICHNQPINQPEPNYCFLVIIAEFHISGTV
jgi:hypothetical protein